MLVTHDNGSLYLRKSIRARHCRILLALIQLHLESHLEIFHQILVVKGPTVKIVFIAELTRKNLLKECPIL